MELVGFIATGLSRLFGKVSAEGVENIPLTGPAIVAINHTSIADVPAVLHTLFKEGLRPSEPCGKSDCGDGHGHVRFMAAGRVHDDKFIGWLPRHAGMIEVRNGVSAFAAALEALTRGEVVGIFPEGDALKPLPDGSPRAFRLGVGRLALDGSAPVIPIAHHDAREIGSGSVGKTLAGALTAIVRRPLVRIKIGEPIQPRELKGFSAREATDVIHERVMQLWRSLAKPAS